MNLTCNEQLMYSTVRIECFKKESLISTGTGFFYNFEVAPLRNPITCIVTNKHVVKGAERVKVKFILADEYYNPLDKEHYSVDLNGLEKYFIDHLDSTIDLCAMPIAPILYDLEMKNKKVFFIPLISSIVAKNYDMSNLSAVEDILMVGYPNGIWDEFNNKPIFRKGITATHPKLNYNGNREFLIDAACFPGSSGSPVFIYNENGYTDKNNNSYNMSSRLIFVGILRGGHEYFVQSIDDIENRSNIYTKIPNNLGVVIKSDTLFDLEKVVASKLYKKGV